MTESNSNAIETTPVESRSNEYDLVTEAGPGYEVSPPSVEGESTAEAKDTHTVDSAEKAGKISKGGSRKTGTGKSGGTKGQPAKTKSGGKGEAASPDTTAGETKTEENIMPVAPPPRKTDTKAGKTNKTAKSAVRPAAAAGMTVRQRVFNLLAKNPDGLTGRDVMLKLGLKGIPSLLKDEGIGDKPRIKRSVSEGVRGVLYSLTAAGRADQSKGKVDENAAPRSAGKDW